MFSPKIAVKLPRGPGGVNPGVGAASDHRRNPITTGIIPPPRRPAKPVDRKLARDRPPALLSGYRVFPGWFEDWTRRLDP